MPPPDSERYLAVLKASYDYVPQSGDEIEVRENQILFLIERTDDDWWKVKIKGDNQDADTPVGLVPAAYVEQAEHTRLVKALYDYEAVAPGELTITEDDILLAFEAEEDWLLVQSQKENGGAGFVPGNYVEESTDEPTPKPRIIVPPSNPRPVSTYVDPADRVAASKVTADDIKTWSVSEVDKKGKKKKGTLGIGNGSVFFASESDKTPVQKWKTSDITDISSEKSKHVGIEISGATPISLLFNVGSKDNVEEIINKLESSRALAKPAARDVSPPPQKAPEKGTVRFSPAEPTIIPTREEEEEEEEEQEQEEAQGRGHSISNGHAAVPEAGVGESAVALYEFAADGDDELTVAEGEVLVVLERDGDEWWKCRNTRGAEGVVPASYLELKAGSSVRSAAQSEEVADDGEAKAARAAQEAADRAEAERLQREEQERAAKERKKLEAQRRAKEAAAAAEVERQKRREAAAAAAKKSPPPQSSRPESKGGTSLDGKPQEVTFPPADEVRTWYDRSGQFRVDAAFLGLNNGKLRLHKINGVIVEVPSEKMSADDMKFIERLTRKSSKASQNGHGRTSSQSQARRVSEEDIPIGMLPRPGSSSKSQLPPASNPTHKRKGPTIDWFDFFLSAGCDMDDCTRYAAAFERDKIDESILADITDSTMRSLGLREGDIIRVKKAIEKRKPGENLEKPSAYIQEQLRKDEQLARQLQEREKAPAPNLFTGPRGELRVKKKPTKTIPTSVDRDVLSSASEQIQRTTSPQATSPTTRPGSAPIQQQTKVNPSATTRTTSGFEDDAWAPRPGSTKPTTVTTPVPAAAPVSAPTPPVQPASAPPATTPAATSVPPPASVSALTSSAPTSSSPSKGLAQTTQSDVFDQLARLSQLRQTTPQPPVPQQPVQTSMTTTSTVIAPPSFSAGLGLGNSPIPMGQALAAQQAGFLQPSPQPQQQQYNGPRGPFAPVPANQNLLQPLIPTQTGFNSFIPTRPMSNPSPSLMPFQNQLPPPSFIPPQPTGMINTGFQQQTMAQPTGIPGPGFSSSPFGSGSMMNASPFGSGSTFQANNGGFNPSPVAVQPTGVFAHSPFNTPASPPPVPPFPSGNSNTNNTAPANVFASMKSGTFGQDENHATPQSADKYNVLRSNVAPQPTGWGYGGYSGF